MIIIILSFNINDSNNLRIIEYLIDPDWILLKDLLLSKSNNDINDNTSNSYPIKVGFKGAIYFLFMILNYRVMLMVVFMFWMLVAFVLIEYVN